MKKLFSILFLFSCLGVFAKTGTLESRIGIKLLPGLTDMHHPLIKPHPRFTFNFGGEYTHVIKDSLLFIETGVYYADRGGVDKITTTDINGSHVTTSNLYIHSYYLSLPILFRIESKNFYFSIGPVFDYHLSEKWTMDDFEFKSGNDSEFFNNVKLGAELCVGKQIELSGKFEVFTEINFSMSSFNKYKSIDNKFYYFLNYLLGTGFNFKI